MRPSTGPARRALPTALPASTCQVLAASRLSVRYRARLARAFFCVGGAAMTNFGTFMTDCGPDHRVGVTYLPRATVIDWLRRYFCQNPLGLPGVVFVTL